MKAWISRLPRRGARGSAVPVTELPERPSLTSVIALFRNPPFERPARNPYNPKFAREGNHYLCLSLLQLTSCPDEGSRRN